MAYHQTFTKGFHDVLIEQAKEDFYRFEGEYTEEEHEEFYYYSAVLYFNPVYNNEANARAISCDQFNCICKEIFVNKNKEFIAEIDKDDMLVKMFFDVFIKNYEKYFWKFVMDQISFYVSTNDETCIDFFSPLLQTIIKKVVEEGIWDERDKFGNAYIFKYFVDNYGSGIYKCDKYPSHIGDYDIDNIKNYIASV